MNKTQMLEIYNACCKTMSDAQIARALGVSRQYIGVIKPENHAGLPEGYLTASELAKKLGFRRDSISGLAQKNVIPTRLWHGKIIYQNIPYLPCKVCGQPRQKWDRFCPSCVKQRRYKSQKRCIWRRFRERTGQTISLALARVRKKGE